MASSVTGYLSRISLRHRRIIRERGHSHTYADGNKPPADESLRDPRTDNIHSTSRGCILDFGPGLHDARRLTVKVLSDCILCALEGCRAARKPYARLVLSRSPSARGMIQNY